MRYFETRERTRLDMLSRMFEPMHYYYTLSPLVGR